MSPCFLNGPEQTHSLTQRFMLQQRMNLKLSPITRIGLPYGARAVLTNRAVSSDSAARKTALHSQAGSRRYISSQEKIVIF